MKNILSLKDLHRTSIEDINIAILSTILKTNLLKLFNMLLTTKEIGKYDDDL